jgi:hypothetical protein
MRPYLLGFLLITTSVPATAQTYHQNLYWLRYQTQIKVSSAWTMNNDIDYRRFVGPDVENQLIIHSRFHYKIGRWDLASGLTYSIAYAAIPEDGYKNDIHELRPVVEASYEAPVGRVHLSHRLRFDNRIFQEDPEESLLKESFYVPRLRYRLQARFPLKKNESSETTIGIRIADEFMVNGKENVFDQNRIYATVEFLLSKHFSFSSEYIYVYQQRFGREEYFSRNVLRLTLIHKFSL